MYDRGRTGDWRIQVRLMKKKVVGLGEVLWDVFPERTCLGGAPSNFAYSTTLLGDQGIVASRLGEDSHGVEALRVLEKAGLDIDYVQRNPDHPTGTVNVKVDGKGIARYEIAYPVAWDFLEWTLDWQHLAAEADAVCFGSLAQRSETSRDTIRKFLRGMSANVVKVFDVNLRQSYYSAETIVESMKLANIVKLNDEELPRVMSLCGLAHKEETSSAQSLLKAYELKLVCITRGERGSLLVRENDKSESKGFRVKVADTVGSGDAFTAGLVHEYLHGASLAQMNETANLVGAWVASEVGAMPTPKNGSLEQSLAVIRQEATQA
jgi:fructokinase